MGHDIPTTVRCMYRVLKGNMAGQGAGGHDDWGVPPQTPQKDHVHHVATEPRGGNNRVGPLWGLK